MSLSRGIFVILNEEFSPTNIKAIMNLASKKKFIYLSNGITHDTIDPRKKFNIDTFVTLCFKKPKNKRHYLSLRTKYQNTYFDIVFFETDTGNLGFALDELSNNWSRYNAINIDYYRYVKLILDLCSNFKIITMYSAIDVEPMINDKISTSKTTLCVNLNKDFQLDENTVQELYMSVVNNRMIFYNENETHIDETSFLSFLQKNAQYPVVFNIKKNELILRMTMDKINDQVQVDYSLTNNKNHQLNKCINIIFNTLENYPIYSFLFKLDDLHII